MQIKKDYKGYSTELTLFVEILWKFVEIRTSFVSSVSNLILTTLISVFVETSIPASWLCVKRIFFK